MSPVDALPDSFYHYSALVLLGVDMSALLYILVAELIVRPRFASKRPSCSSKSSSNRRISTSPTRPDPRRFSTQSYRYKLSTPPCPSVLLHTKLRMMTSVFYIAICAVFVAVATFMVVWKHDFSLTIYLVVIIGLIFLSTFTAEGLHAGGKGMWIPNADTVLFKQELKALEVVRRERKGEFTLPQCGWTAGRTTYNPSSATNHPHNAAATTTPAISEANSPVPQEGAADDANRNKDGSVKELTTIEREMSTAGGSEIESRNRVPRKAGLFRKAIRRIIFEEIYCVPYLVLALPFLAIIAVRYAP